MSRMELASLSWAFSDESTPPDACLGHYYSKADKDVFYHDINQVMAPFFVLSLPADFMLDTLTLPFSASSGLAGN